ncbi:hypothetical protein Csa_023673, partial [Cucumis sativus]
SAQSRSHRTNYYTPWCCSAAIPVQVHSFQTLKPLDRTSMP